MKLSEYVRMEPRSASVEVPCEITPGHSDKRYIVVSVSKPIPVDGQTRMVEIALNVCPLCYNQFAYDTMRISKEVQDAA